MKTFKWILTIIFFSLIFSSCQEYLEKTPEADVTERDIFGDYKSFQGFVDVMYTHVFDYNSQALNITANYGGECHSLMGINGSRNANLGNYYPWHREDGRNVQQSIFNYRNNTTGYQGGVWTGSWYGIRNANVALDKLPLLVNATQEERDLIAGQAYFFRAWFYWEIAKAFGGMPYIDRVLTPVEDLLFPRLSYQETTEKMVEDFDRAIALLPLDWDLTNVGAEFPGSNLGRATKGAAMAFKAKALLFAGSPLMNKFSGNNAEYNVSYMQRAAAAALELIELANTSNVYELLPFSNYMDNFARNDGTYPLSKETLWMRLDYLPDSRGRGFMETKLGRTYAPGSMLGNTQIETVNQLFVDKFEMADGTRYKAEYDSDNAKRWDFRDPRFKQNIIVDRDQWGFAPQTVFKMWSTPAAGTDKTSANGYVSPYIVKKFWPIGANKWDNLLTNTVYRTPHMRLADVYLIYAEAANEAYGASGSVPGKNYTAIDAINKLRQRAGMPDVSATSYIDAGYESFRDLIRNERIVELCFEGQYWFDIRRWYIAHLEEYKLFYDLEFDKDWTPSSFTRKYVLTRVFDDPKHYWMPLPVSQTQIYKEFYQNPGW
jgi:starch-binding outer membrane protein, SusD/RagB family